MDGARLNGHKEKMSQHNTVLRGLAPAFMGSEAVFQADALKVGEGNVLGDPFFDLRMSRIMSTIQTFGFERTKEVFHGCVIVRAARIGHGRLKVVFFAQAEVCGGSVLRPLVTVKGESISDLFCDQGIPDRLCNQRSRHVASNAVSQHHLPTKIYNCTHV